MTNPNDKVDGSDNMDRSGLTKREYFAAMALQGYASKKGYTFMDAAEQAVQAADALIKELNRLPDNYKSTLSDE